MNTKCHELGRNMKNSAVSLRAIALLNVVQIANLFMRFIVIFSVTKSFDAQNEQLFITLYNTAIFLTAFSDFGLRNSFFLWAAKDGKLDFDYIRHVFFYRLSFGVLAFSLMVYVINLSVVSDQKSWLLILGFGAIAANSALADPALHVLRACGRAVAESIIRLCELAVLATLIIIALTAYKSVEAVVFCFLISTTLRTFIAQIIVHKQSSFYDNGDYEISLQPFYRIPNLFKKHIVPGVSFLMHNFLSRFPLILGPLVGLKSGLAVYGVFLMLSQLLSVFANSLAFYLLPRMYPNSEEHIARRTSKIFLILLTLVISGTIFGMVGYAYSEEIYHLFGLNEKVDVGLLALLFFTTPISLVNNFFRFELTALKLHNRIAVYQFLLLCGILVILFSNYMSLELMVYLYISFSVFYLIGALLIYQINLTVTGSEMSKNA